MPSRVPVEKKPADESLLGASETLSGREGDGEAGETISNPPASPSASVGSQTPHHGLPQVPDHELLRKIGDGSYGEVWLALNAVGTLRAIKIVHRKTFWSDHPFEREFKGIQKFEPISRSHEGLVDVLQIGRGDGYFYYVMELADPVGEAGEKVGKWESESKTTASSPRTNLIDPATYSPRTLANPLLPPAHFPTFPPAFRTRLPPAECIRIGLALTDALAHLHRHGLVHRDIKPANIIFVGGVPKLADIGLVAEVSEARSYVGTEGFIPPEGPGTPQADLYSLGKLLYEISTGQDRHAFPALPSDLAEQNEVAQLVELNAILLKACQPGPRERYQRAEEMQADLVLLQRGKSVKHKRTVEHRWAVGKKSALVTASAALILVVAYLLVQAVSQRRLPKSHFSSDRVPLMQGTTNVLAWNLYQEGLYSSRKRTPEGIQAGIDKFQRAARLDPRFALPHAGLFEMYVAQANNLNEPPLDLGAKLRASAQALKELDNNLAETHTAQAWVKTEEWNWAEAEREYQQAIQINPDYALAHAQYGFWLSNWGRARESRQELLRADEIDPTFPFFKKNLGHPYFVERDFTNALVYYRKSLELEPVYPLGHYWAGRAYQAAGDIPHAIDEFEQWQNLVNSEPDKAKRDFQSLRLAYAAAGARGYWLRRLELANASSRTNTYFLAEIHANLGDLDATFEWLEKAYAERNQMEYLIFDEWWDPFRGDPRFKALLKRVGFSN